MQWDPAQYARYTDERARPFLDLVSRIGASTPSRVADLGCGPGNLTVLLASWWPSASVVGIDSSPEMISKARSLDSAVSFAVADVVDFDAWGFDVVISNATLQWVPSHRQLLRRWASELSTEGWLAWQVPGNFDAPSHVLMRELAASPRWSPLLSGTLRHSDAVESAERYAELLLESGFSADVWETTFVHVLSGQDPVLEWVRGTGLRPVLAALSPADAAEFEQEYATLLRSAYPTTQHGTLFPFRRIFCAGRKLR